MKPILRVLLHACALALICESLPDEGDGCTSGFMSVDRMDELLGNTGNRVDDEYVYQAIFPEVGFTCSGSIDAWVFGAEWVSGRDRFPELQIWRPTGDGAYTKVGNTTIMTNRDFSQLNEYNLSSPLDFQAGDVFGYYQPDPPRSQLKILLEDGGKRKNQTGYYYFSPSPATDLFIPWGAVSTRYQVFVNVITSAPGCVRGFMNVERMRLILNLESTYGLTGLTVTERRQLILPEVKVTCDGLITKWIIGAEWTFSFSRYLYPELQVWRNIGNDTYHKINGTYIYLPFSMSSKRIYEYSKFAPIPVQSGDILGIFVPRDGISRLRLRSENANSNNPTQYYHYFSDSSLSASPIDEIDMRNNEPPLATRSYYPLVSVEIVRDSTPTTLISPSSSIGGSGTELKVTPTPTQSSARGSGVIITVSVIDEIDIRNNEPPMTRTSHYPLVSVEIVRDSTPTTLISPSSSIGGSGTSLPAELKVTPTPTQSSARGSGVIITVSVIVVIIAVAATVAVTLISVTVCLRHKMKKIDTTGNVAQGRNQNDIELSGNTAYTSTAIGDDTNDDDGKQVVTTSSNVPVVDNQDYELA